jgi:hypothetical protein
MDIVSSSGVRLPSRCHSHEARESLLDAGGHAGEHRAMDEDDLEPREAARVRRRDHDAGAGDRELMRPGMGKVFKQILDRQRRESREARPRDPSKEPRQDR